jgi:hypothetical protein
VPIIAGVSNRPQLDLLINSLILVRKASSALDAALGLPAADRAQLESQVEQVRDDLSRVVTQLGASIPGASGLSRRPEVKMAAGVVEFLARQGAAQLGAVAGVADTLRSGGDSRALAQRIERHIAEVGVASREDLAGELGLDTDAPRLQEALERALGSGRAEWYGPNLYGIPRDHLEKIAAEETAQEPAPAETETDESLQSAVSELESSLDALGSAIDESGEEARPPGA